MVEWLHLLQLKTVGNYILLQGRCGNHGFVGLMGLLAAGLGLWWLCRLLVCCLVSLQVHRRSRLMTGRENKRVLDAYANIASKLGLRSPPPLYESPFRRLPAFTAGSWRPSVFIHPGLAASLTAKELEAAFAHELIHVKRRDNLVRYVFELCLTALPMTAVFLLAAISRSGAGVSNPWAFGIAGSVLLSHVGLRLMFRTLREISCDASAAKRLAAPLDLASSLLKTWRFKQDEASTTAGFSHRLGAALFADSFSVQARIRRLIEHKKPRMARVTARVCIACVVAAVVLTGGFLIDVHATDHYRINVTHCSWRGPACGPAPALVERR